MIQGPQNYQASGWAFVSRPKDPLGRIAVAVFGLGFD